ncbi:metal-binding protein [Aeoliella mucimassa]|uniref:SWIM-type domain-containing protein n=1 Tax=Aeoliella mucimassa TaxID=2527972 RepID=A0A518AUD7_9BACT|nr:metal-binding protein [Aeoliella mucimassa]QDU58348.1 hypothetical protein Pan181_45820 [Aeoliella mucimassa]
MKLDVAYRGRSELVAGSSGSRSLRFATNLNREAVAFDAALKMPLRFREAISALHDVVISDLRFQPRDHDAYDAWKKGERLREMQLHRAEYERLKKEVLIGAHQELAGEFEERFKRLRKKYWDLRNKHSIRLRVRNPELWRMLMPADPVVTVADDTVFFECFSADQASYGCLNVVREDAFGTSSELQLGTTNVDYSWALYDHFQTLRSYRETRLKVDPQGFGSTTTGAGEHREEKIDLPEGWLRGFMQLQSGMTLPMRRVTLSRDSVYSLLAWLRRHKAKRSPRAIRFELTPGEPPNVVLEPWEERIVSHGTRHDGSPVEPIRIWGGRRLLSLARVLPLMESCDVYLLGTGLPSFWIAKMGEMQLTLGLSGWTANDWSSGGSLESLLPPGEPSPSQLQLAAKLLQRERALRFDDLQASMACNIGDCAAALNQLAYSGQVIHDLAAGVYRWRQVMPMALGEAELGPASPEVSASRVLLQRNQVSLLDSSLQTSGVRVGKGTVERHPVEVVIDVDGMIKRGKCSCSHHHRAGIRRGACRHLLALRAVMLGQSPTSDASTDAWYHRLLNLSRN